MRQHKLWIIGDWQHTDFAAPLKWLHDRAGCVNFSSAVAALGVARASTGASIPDSILLMQSHPGRFVRDAVERLHAAAPLVRLVALVGPWCEGELRSGRPWPGVVRVPWWAWRSRLPLELGLGTSQQTPATRLPRTATEADRLEHRSAALPGDDRFRGTAVICTDRRATFDSLQAALLTFGLRAVWRMAGDPPPLTLTDLMVIDGWENVETPKARSPQASDDAPVTPRLLLLHFPRPDDHERAAASGIAAVIAQPFLRNDLAATLATFMLPAVDVPRDSAA